MLFLHLPPPLITPTCFVSHIITSQSLRQTFSQDTGLCSDDFFLNLVYQLHYCQTWLYPLLSVFAWPSSDFWFPNLILPWPGFSTSLPVGLLFYYLNSHVWLLCGILLTRLGLYRSIINGSIFIVNGSKVLARLFLLFTSGDCELSTPTFLPASSLILPVLCLLLLMPGLHFPLWVNPDAPGLTGPLHHSAVSLPGFI